MIKRKETANRCRQGVDKSWGCDFVGKCHGEKLKIQRFRNQIKTTEEEGFEPSVGSEPYTGFRNRPFQPLRHPSKPR